MTTQIALETFKLSNNGSQPDRPCSPTHKGWHYKCGVCVCVCVWTYQWDYLWAFQFFCVLTFSVFDSRWQGSGANWLGSRVVTFIDPTVSSMLIRLAALSRRVCACVRVHATINILYCERRKRYFIMSYLTWIVKGTSFHNFSKEKKKNTTSILIGQLCDYICDSLMEAQLYFSTRLLYCNLKDVWCLSSVWSAGHLIIVVPHCFPTFSCGNLWKETSF